MLGSSSFRLRQLLLALTLGVGAASAQTPSMVQDPHHGDTLFHFYQSKYFSAITALMVSQHFDRLPHHADEAEMLRGGLLLSYGMHQDAEAIFVRLADATVAPAVRDRAWFYLAKIRHQRGLGAQAEAALARVGDALPTELAEDHALLRAQLLMARGEDAAAVQALHALASRPAASRYVQFNLGVALVRAGDAVAGRALLDKLGSAPAADEEERSLRDKANVALGFSALKDERPADARLALQRVRLQGLQSNKALLGFGWAAASLKDHEAALVPWTELATRDSGDAAVLEARIAIPYAMAELGAHPQALRGYEDAVAAFDQERGALSHSISAVRSDAFLHGLAKASDKAQGDDQDSSDRIDEMGWFASLKSLPELPHPGHLASVLAEHEFQEAFKNYRDLLFVQRNLEGWLSKLASFDDMLGLRRLAFSERAPAVRRSAGAIHLETLAQSFQELNAQMQRVQAESDTTALADTSDRALLARIQQAKSTAQAMGETPEAAAARERLRLAEGALTWRMTQVHPQRMWELRKSMAVIDQQLTQARSRETALNKAQTEEPKNFDAFAARIKALDTQLKSTLPKVVALRKDQEQAVQQIAVLALERQQQRLTTYVRQARHAMAQLYDQAAVSIEAKR